MNEPNYYPLNILDAPRIKFGRLSLFVLGSILIYEPPKARAAHGSGRTRK